MAVLELYEGVTLCGFELVSKEVAKEMTVAQSLDARMLEKEIKENNIVVKSIKSGSVLTFVTYYNFPFFMHPTDGDFEETL